jgi:hypothetical protein
LQLLAVQNLQRGAYTKNPCVTDPNKPLRNQGRSSHFRGIADLGREIIMKRVAFYIRVSTSKQDTENQRRELEVVADRSGWKIVKVYEDAGISGAKGRDQRPALDAMMKAVNAKEFDMVATWSVDRLGRSLTDLLGILQGLTPGGFGSSWLRKASLSLSYRSISPRASNAPMPTARSIRDASYPH